MRKYAIRRAEALLERLIRQMRRAARQGDADSIHDLRVAIRRFTQCTRVFAEFLAPGKTRKIRRRLKRLMALAADVRDRDIALELLLATRVAGKAELARTLRAERGEAWQALLEGIRKTSRRWRPQLAPAKKPARLWEEKRPVAENARAHLPTLLREYFQAGRELVAARPAPADLHAFRLRTKRLRYTLELFAPVYGARLDPRLRELQQIQQLLGEINDCAATERRLPQIQGFLEKLAARRTAAFERRWKRFSTERNLRSWESELKKIAPPQPRPGT